MQFLKKYPHSVDVKQTDTPDTWKQDTFRLHSILTASRGLRHERRFSCTGGKRGGKKIFQLWNTAFLVRVAQRSLDVTLGAVSEGRAQFSVAREEGTGHSSLELYRSLARAEQCASTEREGERGRGARGSVEPTPSSIKHRTALVTVRFAGAFKCKRNTETLPRVHRLSQIKTFIQDWH